jgi:spore coat polysaccharide biosynthesis protein SpsF (cytidylyltransferase family)
MKTVAIIQARMASSRLPGKVLADLVGRPVLWHVVQRVCQARRADHVLVATSVSSADDPLARFCANAGIDMFRGSEHDVLDRFYQAALVTQADTIVRITADCPLIDPDVIDRVLQVHASGSFDYTSNVILYSYPDGLDVEAIRMETLARTWREAMQPSDREHVTPYVRFSNRFRTFNVAHDPDLSHHRWTVDEPADLEFVRRIYEALDHFPDFRMADILDLLARRPALQQLQGPGTINEGYYKSLCNFSGSEELTSGRS